MVYHASKDSSSFFDWPMGHFYWAVSTDGTQRYLWMKLPAQDDDPLGAACSIPIRPAPADMPSWAWDGNLEKPTLTPSVFHDPKNPQSNYHWHGFITNGEMRGC
jgi:hypothetical protein